MSIRPPLTRFYRLGGISAQVGADLPVEAPAPARPGTGRAARFPIDEVLGRETALGRRRYASAALFREMLRSVKREGITLRFRAYGASMSPAIRSGDLVSISPVCGGKIELGDVVAFSHPHTRKPIVHRIVKIQKQRYRVRGDNTLEDDGRIGKEAVFGRVSRIERNGRKVLFAIGPGKGLIALLSRSGALPRLLAIMVRIRRGLLQVP